jgi:hypothetical protein
MPPFHMANVKPPPDLALRLAIREALVKLETARASVPSVVAAGHLAAIVSDLRSLLALLEPQLSFPKSG